MPVMEKISAAAVVSLPVCYVCSKRASSLVQHILVVSLWAIFLGIPCTDDMEIHSFTTMVASVLSFIVPLKLTSLVFYPSPRDNVAVSKKTDNTTKDTTNMESLRWHDFGTFVGSFLYYLVPISKTNSPLPTWPVLLKRNAIYLIIIIFKIMILPLFELALNQLADKHPYPSMTQTPVVYMQMEVLFTLELIAMAWGTDIQSVAINLLSGGRLEMLYMHNYPFLSHSLRDLWGRRYNLLINTLLKETVYLPAQNYYGCSKHVASLLAFFTSGLLHSWVAHFSFGGGVVRACLFFVSQALWMNAVEGQAWYRDSLPSVCKATFTICYFYITSWLYVGLFIEAMPDWLDKNPQSVPVVPIVTDVTNSLAVAVGLSPKV